ncbi:MAG: protein kinase [Planctomycetota bacterium]
MNQQEHLSSDQLREYLQGWVDESTSDSIERHLSECSDCEETMVALERDGDTLVQQLRELPAESDVTPVSFRDELQLPLPFGAYELLEKVGQGGMGAVYRGRHRQLNKVFAIKRIHLPPQSRDLATRRFQREILAAGRLDHPAIVAATDAGMIEETHYLVMEYIDGPDLGNLCRSRGIMRIADACEIIRRVADGLAHAHACGVVHRDIKPSNIMLRRGGDVKVTDFGLAQLSAWDDASIELTTVGQLMGTLDYMSPEQAERPEAVDYRADLYALGATLFRLLCGRPPLSATPDLSPLAKLRLLADHRPPNADTLRPELPSELSGLIASLLASDPNDRPASASHVAESLKPFCDGHDLDALASLPARVSQTSPSTETHSPSRVQLEVQPERPDARKPKRGWTAIAAASVLLLAMAIGISIKLQKGHLVIESDATVTVELAKDGKFYDRIRVQPGQTKTRLLAGKYEITLDDATDSFSLDKDTIQLQRGDVVVARIQEVSSTPSSTASFTQAQVQTAVALPSSKDPLRPGDRLRLESFADENLNTSLVVMSDETIKVRLVGVVSTAGKTIVELQDELNQRYSKLYDNPAIELFRDLNGLSTAVLTDGQPMTNSQTVQPAQGKNELLYEGKPLSEWLDVLQRERSSKPFSTALMAVSSISEPENRHLVVPVLLSRLEWISQDDKRSGFQRSVFGALKTLLPTEDFIAILTSQLQDGPASERAVAVALYELPSEDVLKSPQYDLIRDHLAAKLSTAENQQQRRTIAELFFRWFDSDPTDIRSEELLARLLDEAVPVRLWRERIERDANAPSAHRLVEKVKTTLADPDAGDAEFLWAIDLYINLLRQRVPAEFESVAPIVKALQIRLKRCIADNGVDYRIVRVAEPIDRTPFNPRRFYSLGIDLRSNTGGHYKCLVFDLLKLVKNLGVANQLIDELETLSKASREGSRVVEDLVRRSVVRLYWPTMEFNSVISGELQASRKDQEILRSWPTRYWLDSFLNDYVSELLPRPR